jgi:ribosome-associated protein
MIKLNSNLKELIESIILGINNVKGDDIRLLNFEKIDNSICSYFILCSGTSNTHVNAISGSIKKNVSKKIKEKPYHVEGLENLEWVLLDYVNVVVHVFQKHVREFYDLESLWGDAKVKKITSSYQ